MTVNVTMSMTYDCKPCFRVKNNIKGGAGGSLNEDTLGGQLKAGLAQFVALEIAKASCRDKKAIIKYLPWLYHPPSTVQQG